MGQRILVFENNADFVQQLQAGFGKLGAQVDIAESADAGLARAKEEQPDLVLLSVDSMPAPGEAFLLCKKFKSDAALKGVPFVIMGGEHHTDAFESHKKLKKRRADEYLKLPIGFDDLIHQVQPLVPFEAAEENVDDEIDAFADNAFDDLIVEEGGEHEVETVTPGLSPDEVEAQAAQPAAATEVGSDGDQSEVIADLRREIERLEKRLSSAQRASVRPPGATSGVSSREYLDLRESVNRKEKELLELKDQISQRDKQLLEGNEKNLQFERAQADLEDRVVGLGRDLEEAHEQIDAYRSDKDSLGKRLEDTRGRLTRAEEKLTKTEEELDKARRDHETETTELKEAHATELEALDEKRASELASLRAEHAAKLEELHNKHAEERESAEATYNEAIEQARRAHEEDVQALKTEHAASAKAKEESHSSALAELNAQHEKTVTQLKADAEAAREQALAEQKRELEEAASADKAAAVDAKTEELEAKAEAARKEAEESHGKELAVLGRKLSEADTRITGLEEELDQLRQAKAALEKKEKDLNVQLEGVREDLAARTQERDSTQKDLAAAREEIGSLESTSAERQRRIEALEGQLADMIGKLQRVQGKIDADAELLERVRKALGIGLSLLEEQKNQPIKGPPGPK